MIACFTGWGYFWSFSRFLGILWTLWGHPRGNSSISTSILHQPQRYTALALWRVIKFCKESLSVFSLWVGISWRIFQFGSCPLTLCWEILGQWFDYLFFWGWDQIENIFLHLATFKVTSKWEKIFLMHTLWLTHIYSIFVSFLGKK